MSIRLGFYGSECYDLIFYCARVIHRCRQSVMLVDLSRDQSLMHCVPSIKGIEDDVIDYRGLHCFTRETEYMDMDYDVAFFYFGSNTNQITETNYTFLVTDCQLQNIYACQRFKDEIYEFIRPIPADDEVEELLDTNIFDSGVLNLLILGTEATIRKRFICGELGIPLERCEAIWMGENDYAMRISCQYDSAFRFSKISPEYMDLVDKICYTALGDSVKIKDYRKARQKAERGK